MSAITSKNPSSISPDCQISLYIDAFKDSSSRVRHVLFVLAVVCIFVFVGYRNSREDGWISARARVARIAALLATVDEGNEPVNGLSAEEIREVKAWTEAKGSPDLADLRELVRIAEESRQDNVVVIQMPILGIAFDVNDLGLFSGIAILLLITILAFSMAKYHENLYLALWKIRQVVRREAANCERESGESDSNLLYHALAMAELFSTPPSLARWKYRWGYLLFSIIAFIPVVLQITLLLHDIDTVRYGIMLSESATITSIAVQSICLVMTLVMTLSCVAYAVSSDKRWKKAFRQVNPSFAKLNQPPWSAWIGRGSFNYAPLGRQLEQYQDEELAERKRMARERLRAEATGITSDKGREEPRPDSGAIEALH